MSLLTDPVRHGTAALHASRDPTRPSPALRKSRSVGALLTPIARLVRHPAETLGSVLEGVWGESQVAGRLEIDIGHETEVENRRQVLNVRMNEAMTFEEWRSAACELDILEGNEDWKAERDSDEYDVAAIELALKQLDEARISCDVNRIVFHIRTSFTRGLGGMGNIRLYKHSHIGTKHLVEKYIESVKDTLNSLVKLCDKQVAQGLERRDILEEMILARQAFGRSALLLSGGGTLGMNHIGVCRTLWENKLLPRIISGSSAGSIVCAVLCTRTDTEVPEIMEDMCHGELDVFEKEGEEESMIRKSIRFLTQGSLFDISHLIRVMKGLMGDITFQEAYNRTRRILNISVSSAGIHELPTLLNYITAPNVIIWSAVAASCSVPLIFQPASLLAKDLRTGDHIPWSPSVQRWMDGSVDSDLPMTRVAEMFNVNHFIVSQVNPHVTPFLNREAENQPFTKAVAGANAPAGPDLFTTVASLAKAEALHRMHVLAELGVFPTYFTKLRSVLNQKYSGDITILPEIAFSAIPRILKNPNADFMLQAMMSGQRATWPKISRIQNHCAIEIALDEAVQQLRAGMVFSASQIDLRMNTLETSVGNRPHIDGRGRPKRPRSLRHQSSSGHPHRNADDSPRRRPLSYLEIRSKQSTPVLRTNQAHQLSPDNLHRHNISSPILKVSAADLLSSSADDERLDKNPFSENEGDADEDSTAESALTDTPPDSTRGSPSIPPEPELWAPRCSSPLSLHTNYGYRASQSQPTTPYYSSRLARELTVNGDGSESHDLSMSLTRTTSGRTSPVGDREAQRLSMTPRLAQPPIKNKVTIDHTPKSGSQATKPSETKYKQLFQRSGLKGKGVVRTALHTSGNDASDCSPTSQLPVPALPVPKAKPASPSSARAASPTLPRRQSATKLQSKVVKPFVSSRISAQEQKENVSRPQVPSKDEGNLKVGTQVPRGMVLDGKKGLMLTKRGKGAPAA